MRSKKNISMNLSSELKLSIFEDDLYDMKGVICIPFNEYFDTHVGNAVVREDSNHGAFINKFFMTALMDSNLRLKLHFRL